MMPEAERFFRQWEKDMQMMQKEIPAVARGFGNFFQSVMAEGALTVREKELIALGISLAVRCKPCINLHVEKCLKAGATREQILEAAGVAVMMQGGPSFTHVPEVIRALEHLESKKAPQARWGLAARFRLPATHEGAAGPNGKAGK